MHRSGMWSIRGGPATPPRGAALGRTGAACSGSAFAWRWPGSRSHWPCGSRSPCSATWKRHSRSPFSRPPSASATGAYVLAITVGFALLPGIAYLAQGRSPREHGALLRRVLITVAAGSAALSAVSYPLRGTDHAGGLRWRTSPACDDLFRIIVAGLPAYTTLGVCWYAVSRSTVRRGCSWSGSRACLSCVLLSAAAGSRQRVARARPGRTRVSLRDRHAQLSCVALAAPDAGRRRT